MAKVYLICGKICSGKSYYSKQLKEQVGGVILSPDEATYDLLENAQGEFYDTFSKRLITYFNKKCIEIVEAGANVIYEKGLWTKKDRMDMRQYFLEHSIEVEIHYVHVSDACWLKQIEERNKKVLSDGNTSDFLVDEGLKNKIISLFEEPTREEVDYWYENDYMAKNGI